MKSYRSALSACLIPVLLFTSVGFAVARPLSGDPLGFDGDARNLIANETNAEGNSTESMAAAPPTPLVLAQATVPQAPAGTPAGTSPAVDTTVGKDGLTKGAIYLEAETVDSTNDDMVIAHGNVEMRYNNRVLRADKVRYERATSRTFAEGNVMSINPDGSVQFADSLEVFDETNPQTGEAKPATGYGRNVASTFTDNTKIFASEFNHVSDDVTIMNKALFTPCELCVVDGKTRPPVWSVRADRVTQDKSKNIVIYRHAMVMIHGVPIIYFPVLWHPDPSVKRASGFLMPNVDLSSKRGFTYSQPYLWAISPYQSLIIEPRLNTKVNPFLNLTWSRNFYSGMLTVRTGFGHDRYFDSYGNKYSTRYQTDALGNVVASSPLPGDGKANDIGYILASGAFKINDDWRWSFTAEHVEDNGGANLFDRYKVPKAFQVRGDFTAPSRQLINQLNLYRQSDSFYMSLSALSFQSLQLAGYDYLTPDKKVFRPLAVRDEVLPTVVPMLEMHIDPKSRFMGGRVSLDLSAAAVVRQEYPYVTGVPEERFAPAVTAAQPAQRKTGYDSRRISVGAEWRRDFITPQGVKIAPFLTTRHDSYSVRQLNDQGLKADVSRDNSTAGIDLSYPLMRKFKDFTLTLTPGAQLASSPESKPNDYLPNEDSQAFEYDSSTLYKANKSPGYDLYEGGNRVSLGLNTRLTNDKGASFEALVGRSFREKPEPIYLARVGNVTNVTTYDPTGLAGKRSDWIVDTRFNTGRGISGYSKTRLDSEDAHLRRGEVGLSVSQAQSLATIRYIVDHTDPVVKNGALLNSRGTKYENSTVYARHFFTKRWGTSARLNYDHKLGEWHQSEISLIYRDDCTWAELVFQRDDTLYTATNNRKAVTSVTFRLNLVTFSPTGVEFSDIR